MPRRFEVKDKTAFVARRSALAAIVLNIESIWRSLGLEIPDFWDDVRNNQHAFDIDGLRWFGLYAVKQANVNLDHAWQTCTSNAAAHNAEPVLFYYPTRGILKDQWQIRMYGQIEYPGGFYPCPVTISLYDFIHIANQKIHHELGFKAPERLPKILRG